MTANMFSKLLLGNGTLDCFISHNDPLVHFDLFLRCCYDKIMYGHPNQQQTGPYGSVAPPPPGPLGGGYGMGGPQGPPRPPQPMNMMNGPAQPPPQPGGFSGPPMKGPPPPASMQNGATPYIGPPSGPQGDQPMQPPR